MVNVMVYQMVFIVGKQLLVPMAWQGILNGSDKKGFLPQMDKVGFGGGAPEQRINFCLKWSKIVQRWAQKGRKWSKNTWVGHFGPSSVSEVGVIFQSSSRILAILSHSPLTWSQPE